MSLLSVVAEESEECFSSQAHPARETSAKAARQEKIKVERRIVVFVIFINVILRLDSNSPMGCIPHDVRTTFRCKHQIMKTNSNKKSLRLGKFSAQVCDVCVPGDHGQYGTDADHVPVIPGNDLNPGDCDGDESLFQSPVFGNMDMGQARIGE